jgi:hypothetical protein
VVVDAASGFTIGADFSDFKSVLSLLRLIDKAVNPVERSKTAMIDIFFILKIVRFSGNLFINA